MEKLLGTMGRREIKVINRVIRLRNSLLKLGLFWQHSRGPRRPDGEPADYFSQTGQKAGTQNDPQIVAPMRASQLGKGTRVSS